MYLHDNPERNNWRYLIKKVKRAKTAYGIDNLFKDFLSNGTSTNYYDRKYHNPEFSNTLAGAEDAS